MTTKYLTTPLLWLALSGGATIASPAVAAESIVVEVPRRGAGQQQITVMSIAVDLSTEDPVTFDFQYPHRSASCGTVLPNACFTKGPAAYVIPSLVPGAAMLDFRTAADASVSAADAIKIEAPPSGLPAGDPLRRRYVIHIELRTDYDSTCAPRAGFPATGEQWTIRVAGPTANIAAHCVLSFDYNAGTVCSSLDEHLISSADGPFAHVTDSANAQICGGNRTPVDAMLVLDRSCSMGDTTMGTPTRSKIAALHSAATDFVNVWTALRATEVGTPQGTRSDRLGVVFFDHQPYWMNELGVGLWNSSPGQVSTAATPLQPFATIAGPLTAGIVQVMPGGSTSIGDGLFQAANSLTPADDHRSAVLLMSNGLQNSARLVRATGSTVEITDDTGSAASYGALPNSGRFSIYTVTVGRDTAVNADILEAIATKSGGFYTNTEASAEQLRPFFLEVLQNFLRFSSYQTVRIAQGKFSPPAPAQTTFKLTPTTRAATLSVLFPLVNSDPEFSPRVTVTVTPPGGGAPITQSSPKPMHIRLPVTAGEWRVEVTPGDAMKGFDYTALVIADDHAAHGELSVKSGDHVVGQPIVLEAKLSSLGSPILGMSGGTRRVEAVAVLPGQSLGDVLSAANVTAPSPSPSPADPDSAANAKLKALLAEDPSALAGTNAAIPLHDDGVAPDLKANDGIYSGQTETTLVGHYQFLIRVDSGTVARSLQREELRSVHVRPTPYACPSGTPPAACATETAQAMGWSAVTQTVNGATSLAVSMTPQTPFKNRFGPGWADHFVIKAAGTLYHPIDKLNGTYTLDIPFTGTAPVAELYFDDRLQVSLPGDAVTLPEGAKPIIPAANDGGGHGQCKGLFCGCACKCSIDDRPLERGTPWLFIGLLAGWVIVRRARRR